jgi:anthranilate synthase/aminodeoxychorismate synthase-like glutamine amidotransferase
MDITVIDNYDSFTYNLVQYLGELGAQLRVYRNDVVTVEEIAAGEPAALVVSPGPCDPAQAGISNEVIRVLGPRIPTLGVCLGHQCLGEVFGGRVVRAPEIMHGKTSLIYHNGRELFDSLESPFEAIRYHSLIVERHGLPACLEVTAQTADGLIMGLRHRQFPIWGVQFHPESILTHAGKDILRNFLAMSAQRTAVDRKLVASG